MFCTNCGNKIGIDDKHCTNCGNGLVNVRVEETSRSDQKAVNNNRWWHRLGMVIYVFFNLLLLPVVALELSENVEFFGIFTTIVIWLLVLRLIKIAVRYIASGRKFHSKDLLYF